MLQGYKENLQGKMSSLVITITFFLVTQLPLISESVVYATDSQSIDIPSQLELQYEVVKPLVLASIPTSEQYTFAKRAVTLFDLYLDEERPFLIGTASKSIEESVEFLDSHPESRLSVETYCDQRNTTAYGMALGNQRAWQVKEFVQYFEIPNSRVLTVSYGNENLQCREKSQRCWEEQVRVQSAFRYLAISQPKLGCLVRLGVMGVEKEFMPVSSSEQFPFLQKIKLAPVHERRRLRRYVYRSPTNALSPRTTALR